MKQVLSVILLLGLVSLAIGCSASSNATLDINSIKSYKDIPGITDEDILYIEDLKNKRDALYYGHLLENESFLLEYDTYGGFAIKLCEMFSELFEIEFIPTPYSEWSELKYKIDDLSIDFSTFSYFEQMDTYYMTHPIDGRSLSVYTLKDSETIKTEADINEKRIGFPKNSSMIGMIRDQYPSLSFEEAPIDSFQDGADKLKDQLIDAFVMESVSEVTLEDYSFIKHQKFFPFVYSPISMATANPELIALISVINKYLDGGGIYKLFEIYREGNFEFSRFMLNKSFTEDEKAYLEDIVKKGAKVSIAYENENYPVCFYNNTEKEYQGVAIDILAQITELTGLEFEAVTTKDTKWAEMLEMLKTGEASMIAELLRSEKRAENFIWSEEPYASSDYALISKRDYPNLENHQVVWALIGTVNGTAHEEMYHKWFPNSFSKSFATLSDALEALETGEIDMIMLGEYGLLTQTHYFENSGYKVNIRYGASMDSYFGFNKNEEVLRSIINKAQRYVNTDTISYYWTNRVFDYSKKLADERARYSMTFAAVLSIIAITAAFLLIRNKILNKELHKSARIAEEASNAKSIFLANMSHELRTPLSSIIGFSELALGSGDFSQTRSYLNKIRESSDVLLQTINDILDISKIESGKITLEKIPFNLHRIFDECHTVIYPRALDKGTELHYYADPAVEKKLIGDPTRLRQAMLNLLSNAVKFTDKGTVKLTAVKEASDENSVTILFEVTDNGIGMSNEQMLNIFEPFIQADESTTRLYGGTGLGLPITKNIIELMGGCLNAESVEGVGSKFSFTLTFETTDTPLESEKNKISENIRKPVFRAEILICEDNKMNQLVISEHLSNVGVDVVIAHTGKEGVDIVTRRIKNGEEPFDIIFMDIHMPVMDGLEAGKKLLELGIKTPVIALTANTVVDNFESYKNHGICDYLPKPIQTHELWSCLLKYLAPIVAPDKYEEYSEAEANHRRKLLQFFVADNRNTSAEMQSAIDTGDIELAHRLAHTLKSAAGIIGETSLQETAKTIEMFLDSKDIASARGEMKKLESELSSAIEKYAYLAEEQKDMPLTTGYNKEEALALLDKLTLLLETHDSDCVELLEDLRRLPETGILIAQIERYDFTSAQKTLAIVRRIILKDQYNE